MKGIDKQEVFDAASLMWQKVVAKCPDDQLQQHMIQPRQMVRDKGLAFDRINSVPGHYGFYLGDEPVAVVIRNGDTLDLFHIPTIEQLTLPKSLPAGVQFSSAGNR